jgi:hypothetical protein
MFLDRRTSGTFALDVGVLVKPDKPFEIKNLPDARTVARGNWSPTPYDPAKQWKQHTIAGHRAFVAAHAVIIDWGGVEVHVTNEQPLYSVKPVLSQAELIRIATSLNVPASGAVGYGYPISQAVPQPTAHSYGALPPPECRWVRAWCCCPASRAPTTNWRKGVVRAGLPAPVDAPNRAACARSRWPQGVS